MSQQTFQQRRAEQAYCSIQRDARQQPWTGEPVGYHPEIPEPELEVQPARWVGELTFLLLVLAAVAFLLGLNVGGSHAH